LSGGKEAGVGITTREMAIEDYDSVIDLWKGMKGIGLSEADSRKNIETFLSKNPGMSFVAAENGALVGAVLCGQDGRRGFLYHLAVSPKKRRAGVGAMLVNGCLERLAGLGLRKCHIFVMADNEEGKRFWRKTGWQERFDLVVMSRDVSG
jgi:ribosomal protein S18 acetylase RimI-like enzyme